MKTDETSVRTQVDAGELNILERSEATLILGWSSYTVLMKIATVGRLILSHASTYLGNSVSLPVEEI